jgi:hypothetical protein
MNRVGDVSALQCVLGFEIDTQNRMWIVDQGQIGTAAALPGAIKLVIWDLFLNESVQRYVFPPQIASLSLSFLNDIVIDTMRWVAYLSDCGNDFNTTRTLAELQPGLIVYDMASNSARRVLSGQPSVRVNGSFDFQIDGVPVLRSKPMYAPDFVRCRSVSGSPVLPRRWTGVDGIALSCDGTTLYFCALSSQTLYAVATQALRSTVLTDDVLESRVRVVGNKGTASDGLAMGANGGLFMTGLQIDGVLFAAAPAQAPLQSVVVAQSNRTMRWPDTMAFDRQGNLYFVANQLNNFADKLVPGAATSTEPVFFVWRVAVGTSAYMWGCDDSGSPAVVVTVIASVFGAVVGFGFIAWLMTECRKKAGSQSSGRNLELDGLSQVSLLYAGK